MKYVLLITSALLLFLSCGEKSSANKDAAPPQPASAARIISFAPNITEILYELGLGDNVVGVTRFCKYPVGETPKEVIGGVSDYNYEAILRLKPDRAFILKEQRDLIQFFFKYSISYAAIGSDSADEIIEAVETIAGACGVRERGDSLARELRLSLGDDFAPGGALPPNAKRPGVLLCVGRDDLGSNAVHRCVAVGALVFYHQLIEAAGGANVLGDVRQSYPAISAEAIVRLNPDVIIDISQAHSEYLQTTVCSDWNAFKTVTAVKNGEVHCLHGDHLTIPGPRFTQILKDFKGVLSKYAPN